jgi:uncharacterized protein YjbI with pentapeptide repeats
MVDRAAVDWPTCDKDGCIGIRLAAATRCLAHAANEERDAALTQFGETGAIDARGVPITQVLLEQVLAIGPDDVNKHRMFKAADFEQATFEGNIWFAGVTFKDWARFTKTTFKGGASFGEATFEGEAEFGEATFNGDALFIKSTFKGGVQFGGATFNGRAEFTETTFQRDAFFDGATFQGDAWFQRAAFQRDTRFSAATFYGAAWFKGATFDRRAGFSSATFKDRAVFRKVTVKDKAWFTETAFESQAEFNEATFKNDALFNRATFKGWATFAWGNFDDTNQPFSDEIRKDECKPATFEHWAVFEAATFKGGAWFHGVTFKSIAQFSGATFRGVAGFDGAIFQQARQVGPLLAYRGLVLDDVQFAHPVQIEASTIGVCCRGARFAGGVQFRLRWARVTLDDTDLTAPCILAGIPALADKQLARREQQIARSWQRLLGDAVSPLPRLLSLRRANVAGLGLANVDLANCRFGGTHNLDKLRFEADVSFAIAPVRLAWDWRQVIADERAWRAQHSRRWTTPLSPAWVDAWLGQQRPGVLEPEQIAGLYRSLRKGREDSKDEPGAADFYYGEMEMRRHAHRGRTSGASRGRAERGILTVYWLVSGYGLRAWRALAWLLAVAVVFAIAFHLIGFVRPPQPVSYWTGLLYAFRATLSLTDDEVRLTAWGKLLQALLRLTGPVLLGLAILAIRGRVKR